MRINQYENTHTEVEWAEAVDPSEDSSSSGADGYNLSEGICWFPGDPSSWFVLSSSSSSVLTSAWKLDR